MPRYHYQCDECGFEYKVRHAMGHTIEECPECGEPAMVRILPYVRYDNNSKEAKVGSLVKSSIEEAKRAIKEEKKSTTEEYKP